VLSLTRPSETTPIVTLTKLSDDLRAPLKTVRTLVISNDVPFDVVGRSWVFGEEAAATVKSLVEQHNEKAVSLGLTAIGSRKSKRKATHVA
jgi:hypothetical protein